MKRSWLPTVKSIADSGEALVEEFLSRAFGGDHAVTLPSFRQGSRENAKAEPYSLAAWCCQAMTLSTDDHPLPTEFDPTSVDPVVFLEQIARLSQEREGPRLAVAHMRENGIRFVVLRIVELAMEAKVHPAVVAGRVRFETRNYRRFGGLIGRDEVRRSFPRDGVYTGAGH